MYALTTLIVDGDIVEIRPGTLLPLFGELLTPSHKKHYRTCATGWTRCPSGYSVYAITLHDGRKLVVPGIQRPGTARPTKNFPQYPLKFRSDAVEAFAKNIRDEDSRIEESVANELGLLTHDLRALSSEISNVGELARKYIEDRHIQAAIDKIDTVLAAKEMLSLRLDIVDFSTGQFLEQQSDRIGVYKKVDKVRKLLAPKAVNRNIAIQIQGPSVGLTYGPPNFELIPYVVLQNAIKYSPDNERVVLKVSDFPTVIKVHVQSFGPKIQDNEREQIFEKRYRGGAAVATGLSGSGLGLFAAKALAEGAFGGSIEVAQEPHPFTFPEGQFWRTTFTITIPRVA